MTRSTRVMPAWVGPSALVMPDEPPLAMISLTLRTLLASVPMPTISVPRSIPAASAGAPSNASAMNTRFAALVLMRIPNPADEPEA